MRENLHSWVHLNCVVPECQIKENKVNKEREKRKHRWIDLKKKKLLKQIDVYGSLLEGKRHRSLAKPDKIKFLNEPKQTELAKHKHGVNTMHTNICVTLDMSFATPHSTALIYFLEKNFP